MPKFARQPIPDPVFTCAECGGEAGVEVVPPPLFLVCDQCAAISILDGSGYRSLRTQEWIDVTLSPVFFDLLEGRNALLERLTAPGRRPAR